MKIFIQKVYLNTFEFFLLLLFILRTCEFGILINHFTETKIELLKNEGIGFLQDVFNTFLIFLTTFPFFYLIYKYAEKGSKLLLLFCTLILGLIHLICICFFSYQHTPLDVFIYNYAFQEMWMTINTTESININMYIFMFILFCVIYTIGFRWFIRKQFTNKKLIVIVGSIIGVGFITQIFYPQTKYTQNKGYYFIAQSFKHFIKSDETGYQLNDRKSFQAIYPTKKFTNVNYPLLHESNYPNVLAPYINKFEKKPNIVLLIVEGLNNDYIQEKYRGIDLMPNVRKLAQEGLYWNHCLTLGERSFAALPSLTGSLPYGKKGFTLQNRYPYHQSLISLLHANDYYTTFYYGQGAWFHQKDSYLRFNNIDYICDKASFNAKYQKIWVNNFFVGYNDKDLFSHSLQVIDTLKAKNRFDIYFTGTSHTPFKINNQAYYEALLNGLIQKCNSLNNKKFLNVNKKFILSELFVDDAIQEFINAYKKRPDFENTLFVITGDHPMTELPRENSLKRYHVPLILYSPKIKHAKTFHNIVSHLDFYETILGLLKGYGISAPKQSTALGSNLLTKNTPNFAFMNDNREVIDYLSGNYYLSNKELYRVHSNFKLSRITNSTKTHEIENKLNAFQKTNKYVCNNDKILPIPLYVKSLKNKLIYYKTTKNETSCSLEYTNIVEGIKISNKKTYVDISFTYDKHPDPEITIVYQLQNEKNELLFWKNIGIKSDEKTIQYRIELPKQITKEKTVKLTLLFWNVKKTPFKIKNLKVLVKQ